MFHISRALRWTGLLAILVSITGCSLLIPELQKPGVQLVSITPQQISLAGVKLLCRLQIDNPNDTSIPINGGEFILDVEGSQIATGELPNKFSVPAFGSQVVDVIVDVDTGNSVALILKVLGGATTELEYVLTGHIDVALALLGRVQLDERGIVPLTSPATRGASENSQTTI